MYIKTTKSTLAIATHILLTSTMPAPSPVWKFFRRSGTTRTSGDKAFCIFCDYSASADPKRLIAHLFTACRQCPRDVKEEAMQMLCNSTRSTVCELSGEVEIKARVKPLAGVETSWYPTGGHGKTMITGNIEGTRTVTKPAFNHYKLVPNVDPVVTTKSIKPSSNGPSGRMFPYEGSAEEDEEGVAEKSGYSNLDENMMLEGEDEVESEQEQQSHTPSGPQHRARIPHGIRFSVPKQHGRFGGEKLRNPTASHEGDYVGIPNKRRRKHLGMSTASMLFSPRRTRKTNVLRVYK